MSHVITAITVQKKAKNRLNVFLDHQYAFSIDRIHATDLKTGDLLSECRIAELKKIDKEDAAYSRALFFLKFRPRTRMEIFRYLTGKQFSTAAVASAITRLEANGYIDDREFARLWIENRLRFKPRGRYALRAELREKGVPDSIIAESTECVDEVQAAWDAVLPRLNRLKKMEKPEFKKKLYDFLIRRGFDYSICRETCDRAWEELNTANS